MLKITAKSKHDPADQRDKGIDVGGKINKTESAHSSDSKLGGNHG